MRLDAWLRQQHSPAERLRLVERLAQALNTVHDRGEMLAALAPERVEVGGDMKVDLSPAMRGRPEPGYSAPEVLEGGPPSTAADIYAAGALCWEILVGQPCGEAPRPLLDVVPDLPRELANSVMGCLEKSPDWRPKDLDVPRPARGGSAEGRTCTQRAPTDGVDSGARYPRPGAKPRRRAWPRPRGASRGASCRSSSPRRCSSRRPPPATTSGWVAGARRLRRGRAPRRRRPPRSRRTSPPRPRRLPSRRLRPRRRPSQPRLSQRRLPRPSGRSRHRRPTRRPWPRRRRTRPLPRLRRLPPQP